MNRLAPAKAKAIAVEYCTNDYKKVLALLSVGYSETYANNVGLKLFDNELVKKNIEKIQALAVTKAGYSIEQAQKEYEEARLLSLKLKQPAAAVSAVTGKARLYALDKDAGGGEKTVIIIAPKVVSGAKVIECKEIE